MRPVLSVDGIGDGLVKLSWTRPPDPPGGAITGYYLYYRVKGNPDNWGVHDIGSPSTLNDQITGLTNGQAYEFWVAGVIDRVEQQSSNIVTATPYGPVGVPVVSGTPGVNQVQLFWTEPDTGGHPGPLSYFVVYRIKGQTQWITGPGNLSGRITTIPGLTGGTEYEFGVAAQTSDGAIAPVVGTTTATPNRACDVNVDGVVNKTDINLINAARNTSASGPGDVRDQNHDGVINLYDSRQCVLLCTKPLCALNP